MGDKWGLVGAPLGHWFQQGTQLLPHRGPHERDPFLPARSPPPKPHSALNRAPRVILESACPPSPRSKHFVPPAFLQEVSSPSSLVGGAAPSGQEAVCQTPWGSLEESQEKSIFVAQKQVCPLST